MRLRQVARMGRRCFKPSSEKQRWQKIYAKRIFKKAIILIGMWMQIDNLS